MPPSTMAVIALLGASLAAGCAEAAAPGPVPNRSTTSTATASTPFDGRGYEYAMPAGWYAVPAIGEWQLGTSPARRVVGFDTFQAPQGGLWIVVGRRPVAAGTQVAEWARQMTDTKTLSYPASTCVAPEHEADASLGEVPALVRSFHCPVDGPLAVAVHVLAIHGGHGFVAMCFDEEQANGPIPGFEGACLRLLRGLTFRE